MSINIILLIGLDGQSVIIFGGFFGDLSGGVVVPSLDALYVLNLTNFGWFIPNISGQIPKGRIRYEHQANVIGKYMVISFGKFNLIISFKLNNTNL